jgi:hypothetical protein
MRCAFEAETLLLGHIHAHTQGHGTAVVRVLHVCGIHDRVRAVYCNIHNPPCACVSWRVAAHARVSRRVPHVNIRLYAHMHVCFCVYACKFICI